MAATHDENRLKNLDSMVDWFKAGIASGNIILSKGMTIEEHLRLNINDEELLARALLRLQYVTPLPSMVESEPVKQTMEPEFITQPIATIKKKLAKRKR